MEFEIYVINSKDPTKDIDLADPDVHVVSFYMHMSAYSYPEEEGEDYVRHYNLYNFDSQFYLTMEIGLGRSVLNVPAVWGKSIRDEMDLLYTTGTYDIIDYQVGLCADTYIWMSSESVKDNRDTYYVFEEKYGKDCDEVITSIKLNNNPYIQ